MGTAKRSLRQSARLIDSYAAFLACCRTKRSLASQSRRSFSSDSVYCCMNTNDASRPTSIKKANCSIACSAPERHRASLLFRTGDALSTVSIPSSVLGTELIFSWSSGLNHPWGQRYSYADSCIGAARKRDRRPIRNCPKLRPVPRLSQSSKSSNVFGVTEKPWLASSGSSRV